MALAKGQTNDAAEGQALPNKALTFYLAISLSKPLQRVFKFIFLCGKTGGRAAAHRRLGEAKEGGYWSLRL